MSVYKYISVLFATAFLGGCTEITNVFIHPKSPPHVQYAASYIGLDERNNRSQLKSLVGVDPVETEWCAAFLNAILDNQGIPGSNSVSDYPLMARSFLDWGTKVDVPEYGDIMVFKRGNHDWQGHVAIYLSTVKRNNRTYYKILGGNQNDSVNITYYPIRELIDIRRIENPPQRVREVNILFRTF